MKKGLFTLIKNEELVPGFHRLTFSGDGSAVTRPGQFAEVEIPGYFLRRPFSVADAGEDYLTLAVRVRGEGTAVLTDTRPGAKFDILDRDTGEFLDTERRQEQVGGQAVLGRQ